MLAVSRGARSFSDVAGKAGQAAKASAPVQAPSASAGNASGGSTLGQRLSSCLVGMAIGYRSVQYSAV